MDRVLFGDNQFFGVNHASEEKARAQAMRFRDAESMIQVLDYAVDAKVNTFMCTTHAKVAEIAEHVRKNARRYEHFEFYPCMPYAHKYANAMAEHGPLEALRQILPQEGTISALLKGGVSLASMNIEGLAELLIDAEMKMFHGLRTPVVFLQNVVTDLLLGIGYDQAFHIFANHIRRKYKAEPGFITMNLPPLLDALERAGIENPIVCTTINKAGFRMSGGISAYENVLRTRQFRLVAMSVLASGAIPAREAIEYVCSLPNVESIVFGASSRQNIVETKRLIDELSAPDISRSEVSSCDEAQREHVTRLQRVVS
ncbi:hypothetical protein [Microvirga puerhi]|uniref:Uncharacterized protein n=1 Tax=Microvirga puerhi TaxID=2876078 RepID=A0ABS7VUY6_9HYPH|nr:hypothetical protein [Microvirga puerhi]MBZ6079391.1 hypothetical protein [Microvirga puerhi]